MQNKCIIHYLSRPKVCTLPLGLGDFLRGVVNCYELCDQYDYDMVINRCSNDIFKYFQNNDSYVCYDVNQTQIKEIYFHPDDVDTTINNLFKEGNKELNIYTNLANKNFNGNGFTLWPETISQKTLSFVKSIINPTKDLRDKIDEITPKENYSVVHVRSGDYDIFKDKSYDHKEHLTLHNKEMVKLFSIIENIDCAGKLFLVCDSERVGGILKEKYDHLIYTGGKKSAIGCDCFDDEENVDTLIDFFITTNADKIYSYSIYGISGFTYSASKLFNIPFEEIK